MNEHAAREIRRQADVQFLIGLEQLASDASKPRELRDRATALAMKFRMYWINMGRSGDRMTTEERRFFHTA